MKKVVTEHRNRREEGDYSLAPFLDALLDNLDDEDEIIDFRLTANNIQYIGENKRDGFKV